MVLHPSHGIHLLRPLATGVSRSSTVLSRLRGGAAAPLLVTTLRHVVDRRGGGHDGSEPEHALRFLSPQATSILLMAVAMSLHYLGYSFARPSTIALFTSKTMGYRHSSAFPLAMAFVSPLSFLLLVAYGGLLEEHGPTGALTRTTLFCSSILMLAAATLWACQTFDLHLFAIPLAKFITGPLFVFRESYVQLITSQYWSFIASILTPEQSATWFAPISGLTSLTSALAGLSVRFVVDRIGLIGAVFTTGFVMLFSILASSAAYSIAARHGFDPSAEILRRKSQRQKGRQPKVQPATTHKRGSKADAGAVSSSSPPPRESIITTAADLFRRVPILWALFLEVLSSQGLATLLNVCFVGKLTLAIPDDSRRAGWMGRFFALINVITMGLQFGVLPLLMQVLEPRVLWRVLPSLVLGSCIFQASSPDPTLEVIAGSLFLMKTLEYSARRMLDEMVYVPLDFESRYVGKEVVGVLAYRLGKSLMSLSLSTVTVLVGNLGLRDLSTMASATGVLWLSSAWNLSTLIPSKKEAAELYDQERGSSSARDGREKPKSRRKGGKK